MTKPQILAVLALTLVPLTAMAAPQFYNTIDGSPLNFDDASTSQVEAIVRKLPMTMPASHKMDSGAMKH
jgi:hypothetical protein